MRLDVFIGAHVYRLTAMVVGQAIEQPAVHVKANAEIEQSCFYLIGLSGSGRDLFFVPCANRRSGTSHNWDGFWP